MPDIATVQVRDRDGEMRTVAVDEDVVACICVGVDGWGPETADGRPRPCLAHRPHLVGRVGPQRRPWGAFAAR